MNTAAETIPVATPKPKRRNAELADAPYLFHTDNESGVTIIHGDALAFLEFVMPASYDLVITSPPYGAARTYGIGFRHTHEEWVRWAFPRYWACLRACRGLVAWNVDGPTTDYRWSALPHKLAAALDAAGAFLRRDVIYQRSGIPGSGSTDWFRCDHEPVICATRHRGQLPWSDNAACGHPPKWAPGGDMSYRVSDGTRINQWGGRKVLTRRASGERQDAARPSHATTAKRDGDAKIYAKTMANGEKVFQTYTPPKQANPGSIVSVKVGGNLMGSKLAHENEAPFALALPERFIRSFCPPGGVVIDPFGGSGTTIQAAVLHGRRCIAIDIRKSQCELMVRRLAEAKAQAAAARSHA